MKLFLYVNPFLSCASSHLPISASLNTVKRKLSNGIYIDWKAPRHIQDFLVLLVLPGCQHHTRLPALLPQVVTCGQTGANSKGTHNITSHFPPGIWTYDSGLNVCRSRKQNFFWGGGELAMTVSGHIHTYSQPNIDFMPHVFREARPC